MKTTKLILIVIPALIIAACSSSKKVSTSIAPSTPASRTTPENNFLFVKPAEGIPAPGNEELIAIQAQYKDVTLEKLKEGHTIYTAGACTNCHGAINIYQYAETQWKGIVEDMAQRAYLSDVQKDAVYKYVLAIKATQPK
ncbi:MAG: hypothetical protein V4547_00135 [Bacteroidota bacterium]